MSRRYGPVLPITFALAALAGCGGGAAETGGGAGGPTQGGQPAEEQPTGGQTQSGQSAGGGGSCANVPVPGHEAVNLRAQGVPCALAKQVAAAALGKGRRPYQAAGFRCQPSEADGGDTNYTCTQGDLRVTFRYGTA